MTSYFVDPSIDADSGSGTIGDPYGDLQYGLNQNTIAEGDVWNIKSGTAEVLTASIAGTGYGIYTQQAAQIVSNLIEGFNGPGGNGIHGGGGRPTVIVGNGIYQCTTAINADLLADASLAEGNETLSESPFVDAGSGDFTTKDTGDNKQGAHPRTWNGLSITNRLWKGAIEPAEPAGGGGGLLVHPGMGGGMRG